MARYGGTAIAINPGKDTWNFETKEGVVMDANTQEHIRELAPVITRMSHYVGIRKSELITVGSAQAQASASYEELAQDEFIHRFIEFAEAPVVNLESNRWHPMQSLADSTTMVEKLGDPRGQKYVLTWADSLGNNDRYAGEWTGDAELVLKAGKKTLKFTVHDRYVRAHESTGVAGMGLGGFIPNTKGHPKGWPVYV